MNPYIGEIRMVGFNFAPTGWALCNGQLLSISQNTALFSILGTYFGGNGTSNFALPNLQASAPIGTGNGSGLTPRLLGDVGGENAVSVAAGRRVHPLAPSGQTMERNEEFNSTPPPPAPAPP